MNKIRMIAVVFSFFFIDSNDQFKPSIIECDYYTGIDISGNTKILAQHFIAAKKCPEKYQNSLKFYGPRITSKAEPIAFVDEPKLQKYSLDDVSSELFLKNFFIQKIKTDKYKIFFTNRKDDVSQYYQNKMFAILNKK